MIDSATSSSYIATVRAALAEALAEANTTSDPNLKATIVTATNMLKRSIDDWATTQLTEANSGNVPGHDDAWWTSYGDNLLLQAQRYVQDNGSFYVQHSQALMAAGDVAQDIESAVAAALSDARTEYNNLVTEFAGFDEQQQAVEALAATLKPHESSLSDESHDLLFGNAAQDASTALAQGHTMLNALKALLDAADAGAKFIFQNNDLVQVGSAPTSSTDDGSENQSLGAFPMGLAITGGVLVLVAGITAYAVYLHGYYEHATAVTEGETVDANSKLYQSVVAKGGSNADAKAAVDAVNAANKSNPPGGGGGDNSAMGLVKKYGPYVAVGGVALIGLTVAKDVIVDTINDFRKALSFKKGRR